VTHHYLALLVIAIFFVAGLASVKQSIKNIRTTDDSQVARWFILGFLMIAGSLVGFVIWL